jgi:rhodanese-related sulfurtransferase
MPIQEIDPKGLQQRLEAGEAIVLIDVREASEKEIADLGGALIPMKEVPTRLAEIPRDVPVVIYCRSGGRSGRVVADLQAQHGYTNLMNLRGGTLQWSDDVDPSMKKY